MSALRISGLVAAVLAGCAPTLPTVTPRQEQALYQQWTPEQRSWFHNASQGTLTFGIPYEWFMALPAPDLNSKGWLSDPGYLQRFGFIPASVRSPDNPDQLPIGFAVGNVQVDPRTGKPVTNPATGQPLREFGLTCAACHTGQIVYQNVAMTVDGGSAMIDLGKLRQALGIAIVRTVYFPWRFQRFADRLLGPNASQAQKTELSKQLNDTFEKGKKIQALDDAVADRSIEEGFGRLDALNRIGNEVFAIDMADAAGNPNPANYAPTDAPVHYPRIWLAPWFGWAQYNGSIQQPMVRNAGEAMGVRALVNLANPARPLFDSSVNFHALARIEDDLAGPYDPGSSPLRQRKFTGLVAPRWPESLPPIDRARAAQGQALYAELCSGCHLPAINTPAFWSSEHWRAADSTPGAHAFLDLKMVDISYVGTDPAQAEGMARRAVTGSDALGIPSGPFGPTLGDVVAKVRDRWYDGQQPPVSPQSREQMNGYRPNGTRTPMQYKARPLDGIWATPPYLHNGSVPNLYALLSPPKERPTTFWLGSHEYDPIRVGYKTDPIEGGFKLDTSIRGNSNKGHGFDDGPKGQGVIGRKLEPEERLAIIEYLKTL